jgi:hypothetical protein
MTMVFCRELATFIVTFPSKRKKRMKRQSWSVWPHSGICRPRFGRQSFQHIIDCSGISPSFLGINATTNHTLTLVAPAVVAAVVVAIAAIFYCRFNNGMAIIR